MEKTQNLSVVAADLADKFDNDMFAHTLAKCTRDCFMSMQEDKMLPTEERCMRNCVMKQDAFRRYFEDELKYTLRNVKF